MAAQRARAAADLQVGDRVVTPAGQINTVAKVRLFLAGDRVRIDYTPQSFIRSSYLLASDLVHIVTD